MNQGKYVRVCALKANLDGAGEAGKGFCKLGGDELGPGFKIIEGIGRFFCHQFEDFQGPVLVCVIGRVKDKNLGDFFCGKKLQFGADSFHGEEADGFASF